MLVGSGKSFTNGPPIRIVPQNYSLHTTKPEVKNKIQNSTEFASAHIFTT